MPGSFIIAPIVSFLVAALAVPGPIAPEPEIGAADRFFAGLGAHASGRASEAMELLQYETGNPCFELVRLSIRARLFLADSLKDRSLAEARAAIDAVKSHPYLATHPACADALECLLRAASCPEEAEAALEAIGELGRDRAPSGAFIACANAMKERGAAGEALSLVGRALAARPGPGDAADFEVFLGGGEEAWAGLPEADLAALARRSIELGLLDEAEGILAGIGAAGGGRNRSLLEGMLLERRGALAEAAAIYRSLARSGCSDDTARESCLRLASLELANKRYARAVARYREFAERWPGDARRARSLDTAARIEVSLGRRGEALALWKAARSRGLSASGALDAALSEAALRCSLGQRTAARRILRTIAPVVPAEMKAAVAYWRERASDAEDERAGRRAALETAHPRSYALLVARGGGRPDDRGAMDPRGRIAVMERFELAAVDSILNGAVLPDSIASHAAARAMRSCAAHRLPREAARWAAVLAQRFPLDGAQRALLRADARRQGIWLDLSGGEEGEAGAWILDHPVVLAGEIERAAGAHGVSPDLILAVARVESRFDERAVSRAGAAGIMQLMPGTAVWIDRSRGEASGDSSSLFEAGRNLDAGSWYLARLMNQCGGSLVAALAAYNAGAGATARWRQSIDAAADPMLAIEMIGQRETRAYVRRVLDSYAAYLSMTEARLALR